MSRYVSPRFVSWLATGIAAAFLVVATTAFSLSTIMWLAFAISIGTLVVSKAVSVTYYRSVATLVTGLVTALVSAWNDRREPRLLGVHGPEPGSGWRARDRRTRDRWRHRARGLSRGRHRALWLRHS
jgi:hypothetical protein